MCTYDVCTTCHAGMVSGDMQQEQGRRNWEEETQRRYELEQLAEADRDQRVDVSCHHICLEVSGGCYMLLQYSIMDNLRERLRLSTMIEMTICPTDNYVLSRMTDGHNVSRASSLHTSYISRNKSACTYRVQKHVDVKRFLFVYASCSGTQLP